MTANRPIRIGTRASPLARWQAQWVADRLAALGHAVELVPITTRGDAKPHDPVQQLGGTGLFTRELQRAMLDERIDVAVHSLKDLPTEPVAGLLLAAVPQRESPWDVLVGRAGLTLETLPKAACVGTGSLRRQSQLLHIRPDLRIRPIRGNVETRLRKLASEESGGEFDALVLAEAGLKRLGLSAAATQIFSAAQMMPAVGQGALGLEIRDSDGAVRAALAPLNDAATLAAVLAERSLLAALGGGCLAPVGAWGRISSAGQLELDAVVLSSDGARRLHARGTAPADDPASLGCKVSSQLLDQGARELICAARNPADGTAES